ncbi:hypothetical protein GQ53DRAFT_741412 [Thozetella sp. PMI_491]|nr:hypothetical protein GQ53DRAFT_741412 [Thozetella sp. PMI_491]
MACPLTFTRPVEHECVSRTLDLGSLHKSETIDVCLGLEWPMTDIQHSSLATIPERRPAKNPKQAKKQKAVTLLTLPFEIRLAIYKWILLLNPIDQSQLCSWYPSPNYRAYFHQVARRPGGRFNTRIFEPLYSGEGAEEGHEDSSGCYPPRPRLLSPFRPVGFISAALMRTCRQAYEETRLIPFHENEFLFASWFSSGLTAARLFVGRMEPWQRSSMRYARLETRVKDIGLEERLQEWEELCEFWSPGLMGLRLKIELEEHTLRAASGQDVWSSPSVHAECEDPKVALGWTREPYRWVERGLVKLRALRALEVELAGFPLTNEEKAAWCQSVDHRLNKGRREEDRMSVRCVQASRRKASSR